MNNIICRVCLKPDSFSFSLFELFNNYDLVDLIVELCNIQITKTDSFPQIICNNCANTIISACEIRKLCIESDKYLRSKVNHEVELHEEDASLTDDSSIQLLPIKTESEIGSVTVEHFDKRKSHHRTEKTNKYDIECPLCRKIFMHISNLKRHLNIHRNESPFDCDACTKTFDSTLDLYEHIKEHRKLDRNKNDGGHLINCHICQAPSTSYTFFVNHMRTKHQIFDSINPFKCNGCEMRFNSKQAMQRHIDNVHDKKHQNLRNCEKRFICNTCGKRFLSKFNLDAHISVHTGEKPFKCEYCDKGFTQFSGLRRHTYIHTGERPFVCKICNKQFIQYGQVRDHMTTHTNDRPHVCTVCNRGFSIKGNLNAHMLIHLGKKPHVCKICGERFYQSTQLKKHSYKVHNLS